MESWKLAWLLSPNFVPICSNQTVLAAGLFFLVLVLVLVLEGRPKPFKKN